MMAQRFAARAGEVGKSDGFEEFQMLRPADDRTTWLVYTRWRDEEAFEAWRSSQAFGQPGGHGDESGPAAGAQGGATGGQPPHGGPLEPLVVICGRSSSNSGNQRAEWRVERGCGFAP